MRLLTKSIYFLDPEGNGFELYYDVGADGLERIRRGDAATFAPLNLEAWREEHPYEETSWSYSGWQKSF